MGEVKALLSMNLDDLIEKLFLANDLLHAVFSSPRTKDQEIGNKVTIQPIKTKKGQLYKISAQRGSQEFHKNVEANECRTQVDLMLKSHFKQALLCTSQNDFHILIGKKDNVTILKKPPTRSLKNIPMTHDRKKEYLLEEGRPTPFLEALGVMSRDGKVIPAKRDKFRQLNRFVEMVSDVLPHLSKGKKLHIVDFGCGKAYLTFALYHYLVENIGYDLEIHGLDLKKEVIEHCQALADKLGYTGLSFTVGDINKYEPKKHVDMMISLHACDTATDAAIEKAVRWQAEVILCVPCCQHELMGQVKNDVLKPLLRFGILKERFSALASDAARAQLLDILGYNTQILEFIDMEHTPKNLLIRATKRKTKSPSTQAMRDYTAFKDALQINPSLEKRFRADLPFLQN